MKLIDLYKKWVKTERIKDRRRPGGSGGLCNAMPIKYHPNLNLFEPIRYKTFWASELSADDYSDEAKYKFNALRQTIVLLICAMNNEL